MDLDEMLRVDKCRDMDELINFDPDYSPDAGTGLLSPISYKRCYADFLRRENPIDGAPLEWAVVLKWFYLLSRRKTFVGGKCALPSALLVFYELNKK